MSEVDWVFLIDLDLPARTLPIFCVHDAETFAATRYYWDVQTNHNGEVVIDVIKGRVVRCLLGFGDWVYRPIFWLSGRQAAYHRACTRKHWIYMIAKVSSGRLLLVAAFDFWIIGGCKALENLGSGDGPDLSFLPHKEWVLYQTRLLSYSSRCRLRLTYSNLHWWVM